MGDIRVSQALSFVLVLAGIALVVMQMYLNRKKHGSCFGAKIGEPLAIMPKYYTKEQRKKMEEARLAKERAAKAAKEAEEKKVASARAEAGAAPSENAAPPEEDSTSESGDEGKEE